MISFYAAEIIYLKINYASIGLFDTKRPASTYKKLIVFSYSTLRFLRSCLFL